MLLPNNKSGDVFSSAAGYVATISAIIVTSIVIVIAIVFSSSNFLGRFDSQNTEMKDIAREVAMGCLEYARLKLAQGSYGGDEVKIIGGYSCYIPPIEASPPAYVIRATSTILGKESRLKLTVSMSDLETISLEEY